MYYRDSTLVRWSNWTKVRNLTCACCYWTAIALDHLVWVVSLVSPEWLMLIVEVALRVLGRMAGVSE